MADKGGPMRSAFASTIVALDSSHALANGGTHHGEAYPEVAPATGGHSHSPADHEAPKRRGLTSFLNRGKSDCSQMQGESSVSQEKPPRGGGWLRGSRSKHNRTGSAEAVLSNPPLKHRNGDLPIVGGLPLVEGPLPEGAAPSNGGSDSQFDSPRGATSRSGEHFSLSF